MKELKGIAASSGIARGVVCLFQAEMEELIPHYEVSADQVEREVERLRDAIQQAQTAMETIIENAETAFDKQTAEIFKVHLLILKDKSLREKVEDDIFRRHVNAEHAVQDVFGGFAAYFSKQKEHFAELAHDYIDIRDRILMKLNVAAGKFKCEVGDQRAVVVAAKKLTPSLVMSIPLEHVLAFVTEEGGLTSHAMIIARSFGVPIIFGIDVDNELECGDAAIVDASLAKVIVAPDKKTETYYAKKIAAITQKKMVCEVKKDLHPQTKTGQRISLKLNISTPQEFELARELLIDGIGLLRTEFLFMDRKSPPSEDEQYEMYKKALGLCPDKPVTIRVLDIGEDKIPPFIAVPEGVNLDLSLRGALAVDAFEELFVIQMKALLRANVHGNLRVLYPMVSDFSDLYTYRAILKKARALLKGTGLSRKHLRVPEGIMIETPGAALLADDLLGEVDFINIGSNDLLQYVLAAARGNLLVEERYHILHPALLKMIEMIVKAGKRTEKEVCLCGEIASFEEYYPLLLHIGIKSFSVSVGKFEDIKCEMLHLRRKQKGNITQDFYHARTKKDIDTYFSKFL